MLGFYITAGVIAVLVVAFVVAMYFRNPNKERKHLPNRPPAWTSAMDIPLPPA